MERKLKWKIIVLSTILVLLVCFFSYSVYALINQTLNIQAKIIITDNGQAKSIINVYEALGANDNSSYTNLTNEPEFQLALTKTRDEDNVSGNFTINPSFGGENRYRYYIIKIEIQNVSTVPVEYNAKILNELGEGFVFTSQLELLYLENSGESFSLSPISEISGTLAVDEVVNRYIVLQIKDGLDFSDLIKTEPQSFYLNIEVNAYEN